MYLYNCYRFLLQVLRSAAGCSLSFLCSLCFLRSVCSLALLGSRCLAGCLAVSPGSDDVCLGLLTLAEPGREGRHSE